MERVIQSTQLQKKPVRANFFLPPCAIAFSLLFFLFFMEGAAASEKDPMQPLQKTVEEILLILNSKEETEWTKTREKISVIIRQRFDFQEQSRLVLAREWEKRSAPEKEQFIFLFSKLQEHVYLNRLKDYSGEQVHFNNHIIKDDKAVVFSIIIKDMAETPIVYRMKKKQQKWLVYDVIIDGVSLVKNYRKQFSVIIKNEQYSGLIRQMEEKIEKITVEDKR